MADPSEYAYTPPSQPNAYGPGQMPGYYMRLRNLNTEIDPQMEDALPGDVVEMGPRKDREA